MHRAIKAARTLLAGVLALAVLAGCGIATDPEAREVEVPPGPYHALTTQAPDVTQQGPVSQTLYLVRNGTLVAVERRVPVTPTVSTLMRDLLAGPTESERDSGLSSALPGANVNGEVRLVNGQALVEVPAGLEEAGRSDEILALGQVVCTLDARADVTAVVFVRDGKPISVPTGGGALSDLPLTTGDYAALIVED